MTGWILISHRRLQRFITGYLQKTGFIINFRSHKISDKAGESFTARIVRVSYLVFFMMKISQKFKNRNDPR